MSVQLKDLSIDDAKITFRNFAGKPTDFSSGGIRSFSVVLNLEDAQNLEKDGWHIKYSKSRRNPDNPPLPHLPVRVNFGKYPPKIILIGSNGRESLSEKEVHMLDWIEIIHVDLIIRPYNWEVHGNTGIKAYLKAMYVTKYEDEFEKKYLNLPDNTRASTREENDPPWD